MRPIRFGYLHRASAIGDGVAAAVGSCDRYGMTLESIRDRSAAFRRARRRPDGGRAPAEPPSLDRVSLSPVGPDDPAVRATEARIRRGVERLRSGDPFGALRTAAELVDARGPAPRANAAAPHRTDARPTAELEERFARTHRAAVDALVRRDLADAALVCASVRETIAGLARTAVAGLSGESLRAAGLREAANVLRSERVAPAREAQRELEHCVDAFATARTALFRRRYAEAAARDGAAAAMPPDHFRPGVLDEARLRHVPASASDVAYRAITALRNFDRRPSGPS